MDALPGPWGGPRAPRGAAAEAPAGPPCSPARLPARVLPAGGGEEEEGGWGPGPGTPRGAGGGRGPRGEPPDHGPSTSSKPPGQESPRSTLHLGAAFAAEAAAYGDEQVARLQQQVEVLLRVVQLVQRRGGAAVEAARLERHLVQSARQASQVNVELAKRNAALQREKNEMTHLVNVLMHENVCLRSLSRTPDVETLAALEQAPASYQAIHARLPRADPEPDAAWGAGR